MFDIYAAVDWLKKNITRRDALILTLIVGAYAFTRLVRLDQFPIFSDEGIYIHWAKIAWKDAAWRFISLTDGKQPLQTWGTIPFLKIFSSNALLAGRMFSVTTGLVALVGMISLLWYLFNKKTAYIGGLLYVVTPYFLFYDRLALVDSGVNAFCIWMLLLSILLANTRRLDVALIFGLTAGMGLLAKSSVQLFLGLAVFAPLLFVKLPLKKSVKSTVNYYFLFLITIGISYAIYNIQRLSPYLHFVAVKNSTFILSLSEFLANPFALFLGNFKTVPYYVFSELSFTIAGVSILGFYLLAQKNLRLAAYIALWIVVPFLAISFFSRVFFPRYAIFFGSLLVIPAAYFIAQYKNKLVVYGLLLLIFVSSGFYMYSIYFDYSKLPFPPIDKGQYVEGETVGTGAPKIMEYARKLSKKQRVVILAEGNFGMSGDVLDTFLLPTDDVFIKGLWPLSEKELRENQFEMKKNKVLVVF
ncbi:MAG: glycosyltransferase family 39 protein, partial [Patescibacteria group bacterium]